MANALIGSSAKGDDLNESEGELNFKRISTCARDFRSNVMGWTRGRSV
jgi:hypothetical protein